MRFLIVAATAIALLVSPEIAAANTGVGKGLDASHRHGGRHGGHNECHTYHHHRTCHWVSG
jgi:hypothetical protein